MALSQRFDRPDFANAVEVDLGAMQTNWYWLLVAAVNGSVVAPGWTTTINSTSSPVDYSEPDNLTLTYLDTSQSPNVTRQIVIEYTWTGGNVTQMVIKYGDGTSSPALETVSGGTMTLTYDGSGNFTGATTA